MLLVIPQLQKCLPRTTQRRYTSSLPRPFRFHIGVSWAGKPPDPRVRRAKASFLATSDIYAWRNEMMARFRRETFRDPGEDFFYVREMKQDSGISFGVADGVGGWVENGIDPSLFSQALMYHAHRYSMNSWVGEPETDPTQGYEEREQVEGWELTPTACLGLAYEAVRREKAVIAGSSTACLINLNASSGLLRSANLGDSGFSIIRSSSLIYKQEPKVAYFNCPKQLSKLPAGFRLDPRGPPLDMPSDSDVYETRLRDGDIVIVYTDGISDNMWDSEMLSICSLVCKQFHSLKQPSPSSNPKSSPSSDTKSDSDSGLETEYSPSEPDFEKITREEGSSEDAKVQTIADRIVEYARLCMMKKDKVTPFQKGAAKAGYDWPGGKPDDVTVIVALVRETA